MTILPCHVHILTDGTAASPPYLSLALKARGLDPVRAIKKRLRPATGRRRFDFIFTHGYNGEYGHARHKGVYKAIREMIRDRELKTKNFFSFAYLPAKDGRFAKPDKKAGYIFKLPQKNFSVKRKMIAGIYGFGKNSFEYLSCSALETFKKITNP